MDVPNFGDFWSSIQILELLGRPIWEEDPPSLAQPTRNHAFDRKFRRLERFLPRTSPRSSANSLFQSYSVRLAHTHLDIQTICQLGRPANAE